MFGQWKHEFNSILPCLCSSTCASYELDLALLNNSMDQLVKLESSLNGFNKEAKVDLDAKYNAHISNVAKVLEFQWTLKEIYSSQVMKYNE